jgi:hypothetical protein
MALAAHRPIVSGDSAHNRDARSLDGGRMASERRPASIERVRDPDRIKRYTLVPRTPAGAKPDGIKRFSLSRVGTTPRSPLDPDRLERMERIADAERESRNGGDPAQRELDDQAAD